MSRAVELQAYLDAQSVDEFSWATSNCCHFVSLWVEMQTGYYPMDGLRVTPSLTAAKRLIEELGGSLEAAWTKQLGYPPIDARLAQLGDIALFPISRDEAGGVGICEGRQAILIDRHGRPQRLDMTYATHAWRV